ncbi:hypothetical protein, partial [Chelativorans sp. M5D2P16]|uniref:hypothetical protein n=1 Tax=Chelativorans sp. M5D2P16 TaxID=3095678 RepID=UPI002ACAA30B
PTDSLRVKFSARYSCILRILPGQPALRHDWSFLEACAIAQKMDTEEGDQRIDIKHVRRLALRQLNLQQFSDVQGMQIEWSDNTAGAFAAWLRPRRVF